MCIRDSILMLYGNPQISLDPSVKTVWKPSYQGVWHMGDNPGGAAPQLKDAAQSNDGTSNGAMVSGDLIPGNIGNAIHFDGTDDFDVGTGISPGRTFTEECWIQLGSQSDGSYHGFLGFDSGEDYNRAPSMWIVYQNIIHAGFGDNTTWCLWQTPGSVLNNDGITWNHVVTAFDGTDYKLYVNGAIVFDDPEWAGRIPCNTPLRNIGRVDNYFTGNLDEVRVLSEALSSGWITTEYNNQKSPPTFYSVGVESPCSVFTFSGLCSGSPIIYSVPNTTGHSYSWTVAGGNPSSTIGNSITVTWNASGPYSIQLAESDGSCNGLSIPYTIVVRANPVITAQPLAPSAVCEANGIQVMSVTATGYNLSYQWQENQGSGFNNLSDVGIYTGTQTSSLTLTNPTLVMNGYLYRVIVSGGCGTPITSNSVVIVVNPLGQVDQTANQVVCNGANITAINFTTVNTGGVTTYAWTNSAPGIGLAAAGSGNIGAFAAVNGGTAPVVATIVVTPTFTNLAVGCAGPTKTFTITVNPTGEVDQPVNQGVCNGANTAAINFTTTTSGGASSYSWTNSAPGIGLAAAGSGNIGVFAAGNGGTAPVVATIVVTPTFTNLAVGCAGT